MIGFNPPIKGKEHHFGIMYEFLYELSDIFLNNVLNSMDGIENVEKEKVEPKI